MKKGLLVFGVGCMVASSGHATFWKELCQRLAAKRLARSGQPAQEHKKDVETALQLFRGQRDPRRSYERALALSKAERNLAPYRCAFSSGWLFFRPVFTDDAAAFYLSYADQRYSRFLSLKYPLPFYVQREFSAFAASSHEDCVFSFSHFWTAFEKGRAGGRAVGWIGIQPGAKKGVLFYVIKQRSGRGMAQRMLKAVMDEVKGPFFAIVSHENKAAEAVVLNTGFYEQGGGRTFARYYNPGNIEERTFGNHARK